MRCPASSRQHVAGAASTILCLFTPAAAIAMAMLCVAGIAAVAAHGATPEPPARHIVAVPGPQVLRPAPDDERPGVVLVAGGAVVPEVLAYDAQQIIDFLEDPPDDVEPERLYEACAVCPVDALRLLDADGEEVSGPLS